MTETLTVGFPLYSGCTLLDFAGASQIFGFSNGFRAIWLAPEIQPIKTTESVEVLPGYTFDDHPPIDILFIPGGGDAVATTMQDKVFLDFVRRVTKTVRHAGSVCTGAFIAAAAGILDGYQATTYWSQHENLRLFPNLTVPSGYPRWVIDRDRFTGGGISSSIDLALELINVIAGPVASQTTQLSNQYAPHPPFDSGDPSTAPPEITASVLAGQKGFIETMRKATLEVIGGC